jgi:hypothetical protein
MQSVAQVRFADYSYQMLPGSVAQQKKIYAVSFSLRFTNNETVRMD